MMNKQTDNVEETKIVNETQDNEDIQTVITPELSESKPQEKPRESAGVVLKRAREAQSLSLDIVHEATKIPMDALRAIEEGYTIRMLSPFYYKGFLKMYASYLGIDAGEVIEDYKKEELPKHIDKYVDEFEIPVWVNQVFTRERKQKIVIAAGILLTLFLLFKAIGFFTQKPVSPAVKGDTAQTKVVKKKISKKEKKQNIQKSRKEVRQQAKQRIIPKKKQTQTPVSQSSVKSVIGVPVPAVEKSINLTVRAKQNSWLRVKADSQVVFQSTLRLGAVETWIADDIIEISGKNINQLEFELNGKMIGTLGRNDRNAKKVVITKRGLSVKD